MNQIRHFDREIADLKRDLATMGDLVERSLAIAVVAVQHPDVESRERVRSIEAQLDALDSNIEGHIQLVLALQQPMASDMRLLVSAMRVTMHLETIGDFAERLTKRAAKIARHGAVANPSVLEPLCRLAAGMTHRAIAAYVAGDIDEGRRLVGEEDESDRLTKIGYGELRAAMKSDPEHIDEYLLLFRALSHLEQICDYALSIAEEAVYAHRGILLRHNREALRREV